MAKEDQLTTRPQDTKRERSEKQFSNRRESLGLAHGFTNRHGLKER
jgi:hypothetical protein